MNEPPTPPLVLVVWEDIKVKDNAAGTAWVENKHPKYEPHLVEQVGFLVSDEPAGIIVTHAWNPQLVAPYEQIPRGAIRAIYRLQRSTRRRKAG